MRSLGHLNRYFYKYKLRLLSGVVFVALSNLFAIIPAQVIRHAFDLVEESFSVFHLAAGFGAQRLFYELFTDALLLFGGLIVAMALIKGVFMFFMRQTIIVMSRLIEYDLKNELFAHYQRLGVSFYKRNNTGDLMNRISEDVTRVRMYTGPAVMYSINLVCLFILVIAAMISVDATLTFYVLLPLPVLSAAVYYVSRVINRRSERVQHQLSRLSTFVQEAFSGIRVLKAYVRENASARQFERASETYKSRSLSLVTANALFHPVMTLLIGLSTLLTIYIGGKEAIAGNITAGNIAEFVIYVNMLTWPFTAIGWVTSIIQRAAASQERINEFLRIRPDIPGVAGDRSGPLRGRIEFRNVSFTYPYPGMEALKNVSFTVEAGASLAITGRTGSGKTTIAQLIVRMYDVSSGAILLDGKDIREMDLAALRSSIGYVPQDVFLFSDTIAGNIRFGLASGMQDDKATVLVEKASRDAGVYANIMDFPSQFNTRLGERGITLSGGQKQRISIARAIIRSPRILLFDDCLSAVDTETEELILTNLHDLMRDKTSVIISHRVSSLKDAGTILVLGDGKIIEQGGQEELMAKKGAYHSLYQKQLMEEAARDWHI